ncbi:hypothetical protein PHISCL_01908 [Aspergillus sclerotialis]|uniref:Borealin N-terminal domain-containing protein n=1 Tax=Aspergillus sclerotialis TaxID=2070753 RepID=A0A3A2ZSL3_9EURO|nr:hypothetical protein PHISCL_01908 [Aspergillus sclerotialis]
MPQTTGKRKSASDDAYDGITTPTGSPPTKKLRITRNQKQALMDNLQLEITERARKLRAQYALQSSDLRARIERRVNRIPVSLRKANMGELLEKHNAQTRRGVPSPSKKLVQPSKGARNITTIPVDRETSTTSQSRLAKKQSHEGLYSDKENAPATGETADGLNNPKRRANGAGGTSRVVSQKVRGEDSRILSPKSSNSRSYPHSPLRGSPDKLHMSRPMSPLKPSSPLRGAPSSLAGNSRSATGASARDNRPPSQLRGATRTAGTGPRAVRSPAQRPPTRQNERRLSTSTTSSTASAGTTIVKSSRPATATGTRKPTTTSSNAAAKKTTVGKNQVPSAATKRGAATTAKKAPASAEAPAGRRALRKRA